MTERPQASLDNDDEPVGAPAALPSSSTGAGAGATAGGQMRLATDAACGATTPASTRPPSFAAYTANRKSLQQEALRLLALAAFSLVGVLQAVPRLLWSEALWMGLLQVGVPLACFAFLCRLPAIYRRHANLVALLMHAMLLVGHHILPGWRFLGYFARALERGVMAASISWLGALLAGNGIYAGLLCLLGFQLPPVATAASSLAWAAALSAGHPQACASEYLQHRESRWRLEALYRLLEPAITPLEPLLLAGGIWRGHPRRRCHCVLAALHFWIVGLLPPVLAATYQVRAYRAWRAEERRLGRQQRREQAEAWSFGLKETNNGSSDPGSSSSRRSSGPGSDPPGAGRSSPDAGSGSPGAGSDNSGAGSGRSEGAAANTPAGDGPALAAVSDPMAVAQLSALLPLRDTVGGHRWQARWARRHTEHAHHPDDWQWAWAERTLRALRPSITAAALAAFAAALGAGLHRLAFP
ncbi:hypothetical protein ABPG75_001421 [Micractinium tetrahymenae]